jgi:hypothetical protein
MTTEKQFVEKPENEEIDTDNQNGISQKQADSMKPGQPDDLPANAIGYVMTDQNGQ